MSEQHLVVVAGHGEYGAAGDSGVAIKEIWPPTDEHGDAVMFDDDVEARTAFEAAYPEIPVPDDADFSWEAIWLVTGTREQIEAWFSELVADISEPPSGDDTTYDYWPSGVRLAVQVAEWIGDNAPQRVREALLAGLNGMDPDEVSLAWVLA